MVYDIYIYTHLDKSAIHGIKRFAQGFWSMSSYEICLVVFWRSKSSWLMKREMWGRVYLDLNAGLLSVAKYC